MSFTDLMTGLMVVFMFIAISFILEVVSYRFVQDEITNTINDEFKEELAGWGAELSDNLTVRFLNEKKSVKQFNPSSSTLTREFEKVLDKFIPKYFNILIDEKYIDYIEEIRIEGHTNSNPAKGEEKNVYNYNLKLSSKRARHVLEYIRSMKYFRNLPTDIKERLEFLMTSTGMSFGRTINSDGDYTYTSKKNNKEDFSRPIRVEFKIKTFY